MKLNEIGNIKNANYPMIGYPRNSLYSGYINGRLNIFVFLFVLERNLVFLGALVADYDRFAVFVDRFVKEVAALAQRLLAYRASKHLFFRLLFLLHRKSKFAKLAAQRAVTPVDVGY